AVGHEVPDTDAKLLEKIMLGVRLAEGLDLGSLADIDPEAATRARAETKLLASQKLIEPASLKQDKVVPTLRGRLLDDAITRRLAGCYVVLTIHRIMRRLNV